jgi:hypothetical protein
MIPLLIRERIEVRVNAPLPLAIKNPASERGFHFRAGRGSVHPEILADDFQQVTDLEGL